MKVTCVYVIIYSFCYLIGSRARLVSGLPLQRVSPGPVIAVAGEDAVLRCHSHRPLHVVTLEWSWFNDISQKIVHAMHDGEELVTEKAPEYIGRTSLMSDGSLLLSKVQPQDNGSYRCLIVEKLQKISEVFATLTVAQVSTLNFTVQQTLASELLVLCVTSGWSPQPIVTLAGPLGANGQPAKIEVSTGANGLYSVQALAMATQGSGIWTCKAELPGFGVVKENALSILDELDHRQTEPCHLWMLFFLPVVVLIVVILFLPLKAIEKLRSPLQSFKDKSQKHDDDTSFYGNIDQMDTSGASESTANINKLTSRGKDASSELAENDHKEMFKYKESIRKVGNNLQIHPALIAGIISRQSRAGTKINSRGYGQTDSNCYGLMQINKAYHAVKGGAFSEEHLDQGTTFLVQLIKTMKRTQPQWTNEQQLKGALACYISGEERVIPLAYEDVDSVTPNGDFASDVIARAQWFAENVFRT